MGDWAGAVVWAGAVATAAMAVAKAVTAGARAVRGAWARAVAHEVDPRFAAIEGRLGSIEARLGEPNGKGNVVEMLERVVHWIEQTAEVDELAREGRIDRRRDG